jgi:hypothetical protein
MSEMKLIMESWSGYLNENAAQITTIGELHKYFQEKDPGTLKKMALKYGGYTAKILGIAGGAAASAVTGGADAGASIGAGVAAGTIAEQVVEQLLMASIMAFANLEDGTYPEGTAASYFDLNDHLTLFMRDVETRGKDINKPSVPELEVFKIMKKKIEDAIRAAIDPNTPLRDLLQNITSQAVLDNRLASGEHSGKITMDPAQ